MLSHLIIKNFAIIEHLEIPFQSGLTVLTGETGAGKSIVINALNLLLGGRASTDVIRTGEDQAVVEGIFEPSPATLKALNTALEDIGIEPYDHQFVVRRIVSRNGRNKVFANGSLITSKVLARLSSNLVDISGQHEHYSLMDADGHMDILDDFSGVETLRASMKQEWAKVSGLRAELRRVRDSARDRATRVDFLKFQLDEIDAINLSLHEDAALEEELSRLRHAEKIQHAACSALALCDDDSQSASAQLSIAYRHLSSVAPYDPTLGAMAERLHEVEILLDDVLRDVARHISHTDVDPGRLDEVIARVEAIKHLQRKHGSSIPEILERADIMRQELHQLEHAEEHCQGLIDALKSAEHRALGVAHELSHARRDQSRHMETRIEQELCDLNMARTRFVIDVSPDIIPKSIADADVASRDALLSRLGAHGFDAVEFLIAPNLGESPKPLSKIASGGELSRVMLVMKSALVERDPVDTYVFDEVDTGIGGSTADMVGLKIQEAARHHQVFCITHLPQIASRCDHHYLVEKRTDEGRTHSTIVPLSDTERVHEVARMLSGTRVTDKTLDAAREMVNVISLRSA